MSLKSIGLRFQLGHSNGKCSNPVTAYNNDFVVIAINGIHEICLDYCGCGQATSRTSQLLQARLFPSTVIDPKTAATFSVLEHFQLLSFTSKISGFEFYRALSRITNNIGVKPPPASYFRWFVSSKLILTNRIVTMYFCGLYVSGVTSDFWREWAAVIRQLVSMVQRRENAQSCVQPVRFRESICLATGRQLPNHSSKFVHARYP